MVSFRAPKYFCTICNKAFRRKKQHFNHVMRNKCKAPGTKKSSTKKQIVVVPQIVPELVSMKDAIIHSEPHPLASKYYGAPYQYHNIPTGNSHLRCGVPFTSDPLRRTLTPKQLPKAIPSLGPIPTLSKHKYGLQAI